MDDREALIALTRLALAIRSNEELVKKHKVSLFTKYKNSFYGNEAVTWMVGKKFVPTRADAVMLGKALVVHGFICHVKNSETFQDSDQLYQFSDQKSSSKKSKKKKGATAVMTIKLSEKFSHEGPEEISEAVSSWIPVNPKTKKKKNKDEEQHYLFLDGVSRAMAIVYKSVQIAAWYIDDVESLAGSSDPCYMRFEFKREGAKEFTTHQSSDVAQFQQLMRRFLRFESLPNDTFRRVIHAETGEVLVPAKGKKYIVCVPGRLLILNKIDSAFPESVVCLLGADVWADAKQGIVHIQEHVGPKMRYQIKLKNSEEWKRALVIGGLIAQKHQQITDNKLEIRRAAVLNHEVFFTFGVSLGHAQPWTSQSSLNLHLTFGNEKFQLERNETAMMTHELSQIEAVELDADVKVTVQIKSQAGLTPVKITCQNDIDANLLRNVLQVEVDKNKRGCTDFPASVNIGPDTVDSIVRVNHRGRRFQIVIGGDQVKCGWKLTDISKVTKSKETPTLLTAIIQPSKQIKIIANITVSSEEERDALAETLEKSIESNIIVLSFLNESVRIIRKSGFVQLTGPFLSLDKKDIGKRFLMVTPSRVFVFRDSKGVFSPLSVISLKGAVQDPSVGGKQIRLIYPSGSVALEFETSSIENSADWLRILSLESKRLYLPDPSRPRDRIQDDNEVLMGIIPPNESDPKPLAALVAEAQIAVEVSPAEQVEEASDFDAPDSPPLPPPEYEPEFPSESVVGLESAAATSAAGGEGEGEGEVAAVINTGVGFELPEGGEEEAVGAHGDTVLEIMEAEIAVHEHEEGEGEEGAEDEAEEEEGEGAGETPAAAKARAERRVIEVAEDLDEKAKLEIIQTKEGLQRRETKVADQTDKPPSAAWDSGEQYEFSRLLTWFVKKEVTGK